MPLPPMRPGVDAHPPTNLLLTLAREQRRRALAYKLWAVDQVLLVLSTPYPCAHVIDQVCDTLDRANAELRAAMLAEERLIP